MGKQKVTIETADGNVQVFEVDNFLLIFDKPEDKEIGVYGACNLEFVSLVSAVDIIEQTYQHQLTSAFEEHIKR